MELSLKKKNIYNWLKGENKKSETSLIRLLIILNKPET